MWAQMGPLFWGARFSGHPQAQMHSAGDPKNFHPFGKMDMGDRGSHYGHHPFHKPGSSTSGHSGMSSSSSSAKGDTPRHAHSNYDGLGASNHYASHLNDYHHHNGGHHGMNSSSSSSSSSSYKHKSDINGGPYSAYGNPNHAHQGSNGAYSPMANNGLPSMPPMMPPSSAAAPPLPPPPAAAPPTRSQSPPSKQPGPDRLKKCKAVFGQGQKDLWCNKCRWKKKCIRWGLSFFPLCVCV